MSNHQSNLFRLPLACLITFIALSCENSEREYHSNGKIKSEYHLRNGEIDGVKYDYTEDGIIESETHYKNGVKSGSQKYYFETGRLNSTTNFEAGLRNGEQFIYYPDGNIEYNARFNKGIRIDTSYYYTQDGKLKEFKVYGKKGKVAYLKWFNHDWTESIESVMPIITLSSDTVMNGENVMVEVDLTFELEGKPSVEFGSIDGDEYLPDTLYILDPHNPVVKFDYLPRKLGLNRKYIKIHHDSSLELSADGVLKKINVFVIGRQI